MNTRRRTGQGSHRGRGATRVVPLTVVAVLLTACQPVFGDTAGPVRRATLTSASNLTYTYSGDATTLTASAPTPFPDSNVREITWRDSAIWQADQDSCSTWYDTAESVAVEDPERTGLTQPGLAMRIAPTPEGDGVRAVTVTENIWMYGVWLFNVHTWDTTRAGDPFELVATFDLSSIVGTWSEVDGVFTDDIEPPPWHVCGRTQGDQFRFKVWTGDDPEPTWNDTTHVFEVTLPAGWNHRGYSGDYIGHLPAGTTATFESRRSWPLCLMPDMIDTPDCSAILAPSTTVAPVD